MIIMPVYLQRAMAGTIILMGQYLPAMAHAEATRPAAAPMIAGGATASSAPSVGSAPRASLTPSGLDSGAAGTTTEAPPVELLCKAAVALALVEPERARGFVSRARLAGWLPEIRFRVYRRFARTEGLSFGDVGVGAVAPVDISAIDDVRYEWRATWDLSRMVFNPDEVQAHFEALRMADVRRDLQTLVIRLYFERRRLMAESRSNESPAPDLAAAERRLLRTVEIEAELDALSDGAFSARAPSRAQTASIP
jgi:hypothetical protein